jgi:glucosamine-6-phosphate deaminase
MATPPGAAPPPRGASSVERLPTHLFPDDSAASDYVTREIATLIRSRAAEGRKAVLGCATGATPRGIYARLVAMHRTEGLSFANVVTFNLDEYFPIHPDALQSYHRFMAEALWNPVGLKYGETAFIPPGNVPRERVEEAAAAYEAAIAEAGGIDLQILGIGHGGHIGRVFYHVFKLISTLISYFLLLFCADSMNREALKTRKRG